MTTTTTSAEPIAMITADPAADARRRRGLRRMRTLAVALLVFAAVVYLVTLGRVRCGDLWAEVIGTTFWILVGVLVAVFLARP